jgi:uncharacterized membrane protein YecN with MAPEG domain
MQHSPPLPGVRVRHPAETAQARPKTMRYLLKYFAAHVHRTHIRPLQQAHAVAWRSDGMAVAFHIGVLAMVVGLWLIGLWIFGQLFPGPWRTAPTAFSSLARVLPQWFIGGVLLITGRHMIGCVSEVDARRVCHTALALFAVWFYLFVSTLLSIWYSLATPILLYAWVRALWVMFHVCQPKQKGKRPCQNSTIPQL